MLLKNQQGFTLMETVVSISLFAIVALGTMFITQTTLGLSDSVRFSEDFSEIENYIRSSVSRIGACGLREPGTGNPITFPNSSFPKIPTDLETSTPPIQASVYLLSKTNDPITGKKPLAERFANNRNVAISFVELILPESSESYDPGRHIVHGQVVVHAEKKILGEVNRPLPPVVVDTILKVEVNGQVRVLDCGQSWSSFEPDPPLPISGEEEEALENGTIIKELGKHSVCVIIDRGLKTGQTKTGLIKEWKDRAQRAKFDCSVIPPSPTEEQWLLSITPEKNEGRRGHYNCQAFCI